MKCLKVGIIGMGRSGRDIHATQMAKTPDMFKIVAVTDPVEERRIRAEKEYGCKAYADYRSLLEIKDLDLIVNATPSHLHVPTTLEFLNRGFNVLCDKPLARKVEEVDTLIEASEKSGKMLAIFQQNRYAPHFQQVKKIIDSGVLGRIVQISCYANSFVRRWDWQTLQENYGGSLLNAGAHCLDQVLQLFGTDSIPDVTCILDRVNTFGDADDYVKVLLRKKGYPVIDLEISSCCSYSGFSYNVQGNYGGIKASHGHVKWEYYIPAEAPEQHLTRTPIVKEDGTPAYCSEDLVWHEEEWKLPEGSNIYREMTETFYNMFYKAMTAGTPLDITPRQVRQQIAVIEECHRQNPLSRLQE